MSSQLKRTHAEATSRKKETMFEEYLHATRIGICWYRIASESNDVATSFSEVQVSQFAVVLIIEHMRSDCEPFRSLTIQA